MSDDIDKAITRALPEVVSRRQYLTLKTMLDGVAWYMAIEAVATTAIEHPEWDMDEEKSWKEWEADARTP